MSAEDAARQEATREAEASLDVRLEMMRIDGIAAEIIYPTIGLYVWNLEDPALGRACCREYNDWLYEHLGNASARVKLASVGPDFVPKQVQRTIPSDADPSRFIGALSG